MSVSKLVAGLIPAGVACPFLDSCKFKVHTCPGSMNGVKTNDFSCAAARLHDLIAKPELNPIVTNTAKSLVVKNTTQPGNPHDNEEV
jgi:hypothetical protein